MTEPDDAIPFNVPKDCPACGTENRVRWPADNPDSVTIRCYVETCRHEFTVERGDG